MVSALRSHHCTTGTAAVLRDAGAGAEQPAGITDTKVGWDLESQQREGHPLSAATFKSFEDVGFFTNSL